MYDIPDIPNVISIVHSEHGILAQFGPISVLFTEEQIAETTIDDLLGVIYSAMIDMQSGEIDADEYVKNPFTVITGGKSDE